MERLEDYFAPFREQIVGYHQTFKGPYGEKRIVYADWTASGRLYTPIERKLTTTFGPFVGNTHSESSITGMAMTQAYHLAHSLIKQHVNAGPDDVIITAGFGMTTVINKFQRILGLRLAEQLQPFCSIPDHARPIVIITHMEHHSNQTSWLETVADVECMEPDEQGLVNLDHLRQLLERYQDRPLKIGSFTACSNVTGIRTPYHQMAKIMHEYGGYCFVDFAASAPYVAIDMHPADSMEKLDAIFFSPHKFLGGPGSSGVLIFDSALYKNKVPDRPGGGTVNWTNPWKQHSFISNIEAREDGGTPGFLQAIRTALAIRLKEQMTVERMLAREEELLPRLFKGLREIPGLHILADHIEERLGIISFYVDNIHYNLLVKLLNDRFGIQTRGGCSCAGTYGHYLLHVDQYRSQQITSKIDQGDLSEKPGWVRVSIHPTSTTEEVDYIVEAVRETVKHIKVWEQDYRYSPHTNEFHHLRGDAGELHAIQEWFKLEAFAG
ncbi:MAG: selenocysteine lyase [Herpetosiphonaceae bacterium]|nr:MAG: selenocysteine lyase [Herpetosiphonaceae bacterium]